MTFKDDYSLDETGWSILSELQKDARLSFPELGCRVGLSALAVAERVRKLEDAGVITGYGARIDRTKVGLHMMAFVHITTTPMKERATRQQWEQIADITFHDLRHDFGHRLCAASFSLEEVAVSLGHVTKKGTPVVATTARYTQPSRAQMKHKLKNVTL